MSLRTLPLLYLNLGGEMMYVLDQRLVAQQVQPAKGAKGEGQHSFSPRVSWNDLHLIALFAVLDDIAATMFNRKFLEEIFLRHQALHNRGVLRAMFDKLANASIMRLSPNSMDKLYDLMVMAVKHQVLATRNPHDLVGVTLNHLDAIADYASSEPVKKNVEFAYELLIQVKRVGEVVMKPMWQMRIRVKFFLFFFSELLHAFHCRDADDPLRAAQLPAGLPRPRLRLSAGGEAELGGQVQVRTPQETTERSECRAYILGNKVCNYVQSHFVDLRRGTSGAHPVLRPPRGGPPPDRVSPGAASRDRLRGP